VGELLGRFISKFVHIKKLREQSHFRNRHFAPNSSASTSSDNTASILPCRFITASSASASPGAYRDQLTLGSHSTTHIPPLQPTHIQQLLELPTPPVISPELPRHPLVPLVARLIWPVKHEDGQDRLLEKGGNLVEDCAEEWILAVNGYLRVEDPYPVKVNIGTSNG
jgi:hypothetical protein